MKTWSPADLPAPSRTLTPRERDIARLVAQGKTDREIADALFLARSTVKNYLSAIYDKLAIDDNKRVRLVLAVLNGEVPV